MKKAGSICLSFFSRAAHRLFRVMDLELLKNAALAVLLLLFAAGLLLFPSEAAEAARQGLSLCLRSVLPSLFPFFVLSSLAVSSGAARQLSRALEGLMLPLFSLGGEGAPALVLGIVGGYPVGARTAAQLHAGGRLSREDAERLLGFCSNAGPGFILGVCGAGVFKSSRAGLLLFAVHLAAALLCGVLMRRGAKNRHPSTPPLTPSHNRSAPAHILFPAAVRDSFASVWSVCGFVVIFAVLLRLMTLVLPASAALSPWYPALLGFVELTNGVLALTPDRRGFALCAAMLGWGGLSVHAQTLSVLDGSGLSARRYFLGKTIQAALSAPLAWLVFDWL